MDRVYEQQYKRQRGEEKEEEVKVEEEEEEEEENTWGCLARPKRPKDPAEPTKKTKDPPSRVYPDLPFALRRYAGGSGNRNFYDLRDKLEALSYSRQMCADG